MFHWLRRRRHGPRPPRDPVVQAAPVIVPGDRLDAIVLRRRLLDWRDHYVVEVDAHLRRQVPAFHAEIDKVLEGAGLPALVRSRHFSRHLLTPVIERWLADMRADIEQRASADLADLLDHLVTLSDHDVAYAHDDTPGALKDGSLVLSSSAGAVGAGLGFSSLSVVPAGGLLGAIGLTTVSTPIVVVGIVVTAGLMALGGSRAVTLRQRAVARYRESLDKWVTTQVLGDAVQDKPSYREVLQREVEAVANQLLERVQC